MGFCPIGGLTWGISLTIIGQLCEIQMDRVVQHHCIPLVSLPRCSEGALSGCTGRPRRRRVLSGENGRIPFFSLCRRGTNGLDLGIKLIPSCKNDKSVTQTNTGHEYHGTRKFFTTRAARLSQPVGLVPGPPPSWANGLGQPGGSQDPPCLVSMDAHMNVGRPCGEAGWFFESG